MCSWLEIVLAITCNRQGETRLIINFRAFFSILISRCENQLSMSGSWRESYTELIVLSISVENIAALDMQMIHSWSRRINGIRLIVKLSRPSLMPPTSKNAAVLTRDKKTSMKKKPNRLEKIKRCFCHYFHWFTFKIPDCGSARNYTFNRRKLNKVSCAKIKEKNFLREVAAVVLRILQLCIQLKGSLIPACPILYEKEVHPLPLSHVYISIRVVLQRM